MRLHLGFGEHELIFIKCRDIEERIQGSGYRTESIQPFMVILRSQLAKSPLWAESVKLPDLLSECWS